MLLYNIEKYINGAILQVGRVEKERKAHFKKFIGLPIAHFRRLDNIFLDAHFYFICIDQIDKNLKRLIGQLGNKNLEIICQEFQTDFDSEIRNDLEHIDARAVGKTKFEKDVDGNTKRSWMVDFVNFQGDKLSFGGRKYAINKDSIKKLKKIYQKLIRTIRADYALKDKNYVEMEKALRMTRYFKKQFPIRTVL